MSASQSGVFNLQQFSDIGGPLAAGRIYTYAAGTTTHKTAYTDAAGLVPHTYTSDGSGGLYIALNSRGELPAPVYFSGGSYDVALKRADGSTVWSRPTEGVTPFSAITAPDGSSIVGFTQGGSNPATRDVRSKLREVEVNVRDFNVFAGGGTLDDTATIQKAIDYVSGLGGGWVNFSDGTYLAKNIVQKSGVNFKGKGGVVKTLGTALAGERLFYTTGNVSRVKFRDMILDGNKGLVPGDPFSGVPLIELSFGLTADRIDISECEFRNNGYIAFRSCSTSNRIKVTGCTFFDVDACCWFGLAAASNVRIYGNHFDTGLSEGVTIDLATGFSYSNFTISGNTCLNKASCVFTDGAINGLAITGNTVIGTGASGTSGVGIRVDGGDGAASGVTVSANTVTGHGTGILLTGSNVTCTGNTIYTCRLEGIISSASQATIGHNTVTNINRGTGTPNRSGIVSTGSDVTIEGNTVTDTSGTPIHFSGIRVEAGSNISVIGNRVRGWTDVGYYIDNSCSAVKLDFNDARGGNSGTFFVEGNVDTVVTCRGNTTDQSGTFSINSNSTSIRAEEFVTLSNGGSSRLDTLVTTGISRGRSVTLKFAGVTTVTHSVGNIKTRTGASITTAANSIYQAVSDGTSWYVMN